MTFLFFPFVLAGLAAGMIPVVLHLLLRRRPKREIFPAMIFLHATHRVNRRRMRIKHWLLLAMRVALLVLLGLMLARPSIRSRPSGESGSLPITRRGDGPVAAALVIDTSVRMALRENNDSRLDEAKRFARAILEQLPPESRIAILTPGDRRDSFQIDPLAAKERIDLLRAGEEERSLAETVTHAVRLLASSELSDHEVFILTDTTAAGWPNSDRRAMNEAIRHDRTSLNGTHFYLVDLSVASGTETGICAVEISTRTDPREGEPLQSGESSQWDDVSGNPSDSAAKSPDRSLHVEVTLSHIGGAKKGLLELVLLDDSGPATLPQAAETDGAARRFIEPFSFADAPTCQEHRVIFSVEGVSNGLHRGFVRLTPGDRFEPNDIRWLTFDLGGAPKILLVAPTPADETALFVREALAPSEYVAAGIAPFVVETLDESEWGKMSGAKLQRFDAIFFLDPHPFDPTTWKRIFDFVSGGKGVGFFLGRNASPVSAFDTPDAHRLLGGIPRTIVRIPDGTFLVPDDGANPIFAAFDPLGPFRGTPWSALPIFRYWKMEMPKSPGILLARYADGGPAIWMRPVGEGMSLVATTPFSDAPSRNDPWNLLPAGENAWVFVMLADGIARGLVGRGGETLDMAPGNVAVVRLRGDPPSSVQVRLPHGETVTIPTEVGGVFSPSPGSVSGKTAGEAGETSARRSIRFAGTSTPGLYRIEGGGNAPKASLFGSFCVNYPAPAFDLTPITHDELRAYWENIGPDFIDSADQIETGRLRRRAGHDLFPWVALVLGLLLAGEAIFSNRFYDR